MVKFKEEKGSITLFVLIAMIFFVMYLVGMYMLTANSEASQVAENARIKEIYEEGVNNIDDIYATLENANRLSTQITPANYGDYVNYPIDLNDDGEYTNDWRIFYKDKSGYVYIIAANYLPYTKVPTGTELTSYSGRTYTAYWSSVPTSYTTITDDVRTRYKMNWQSSTTNINIIGVSQLLNTSVWKTFALNKTNGYSEDLAVDAIGAPTLEMWVESWNAKGNTKLYYDKSNENGYYIGTTSGATTYSVGLTTTDTLYFPVTSSTCSDTNGYHYWLASPSAFASDTVMYVTYGGDVSAVGYNGSDLSVRPLVCINSNISGEKLNGVWNLYK